MRSEIWREVMTFIPFERYVPRNKKAVKAPPRL